MRTENDPLCLFVETRTSSSLSSGSRHLNITAMPVYQCGAENEFRSFVNLTAGEEAFADLSMEIRLFNDSPTYRFTELSYRDTYRMDLRSMEVKLKLLRSLTKKRETMDLKEGYAESAGLSLFRFARAIGAEYVYVRGSDAYRRNTGMEFRRMVLTDLQHHISSEIHTFRTSYPCPAENAA